MMIIISKINLDAVKNFCSIFFSLVHLFIYTYIHTYKNHLLTYRFFSFLVFFCFGCKEKFIKKKFFTNTHQLTSTNLDLHHFIVRIFYQYHHHTIYNIYGIEIFNKIEFSNLFIFQIE